MLEIIAYISAVLIGITLGLIGGGGSILTVPVLYYMLQFSSVMATAYSLFIVGASALAGAVRYARAGLIDLRTAVIFGAPSILAVFLTRTYVVPAIPDEVFSVGSMVVTRDMLLMVLFASLMVFASISMISPRKKQASAQAASKSFIIPVVEGLVVGTLTGLVGAGGGFLIIPALILFSGMEMKTAIGTSLVIIATKSLIGFAGDAMQYSIDWTFLAGFTALAVVGILIGSVLATKIDGQKLKKGFGWFVLFMGVLILLKEFWSMK